MIRSGFTKLLAQTDTKTLWLCGVYMVMFGVVFCGMPYYVDDHWFGKLLAPWITGAKEGIPWREIWDTYRFHWEIDNVRLANIVYVPWLLLPKWVGGLICTMAWGGALWLGVCMTRINRGQLLEVSVLLFLMAWGLPWYDSLGALDYQFNYVVSSLLGLIAIWYALRGNSLWIGLALGFLLGWWHEGFGLPIGLTLAGIWVLFKTLRGNRALIGVFLGCMAGTVMLFTSPAVMQRVTPWNEVFSLSHFAYLIPIHGCMIFMIIMGVILIWQRKREVFSDPLLIILVLSAFISLGIHFFGPRQPRTGWWCEFASAIAAVMMLREIRFKPLIARIMAWLLLVVTFIHLLAMDYYTIGTARFYKQAIADYQTSKDGVVFADFVDESQASLWAWNSPDFTLLLAPAGVQMVADFYDRDSTPPILVPKELEYYRHGEGERLEGEFPVWRVGDRLVIEADAVTPQEYLYSQQEPGSVAGGEFAATVDFSGHVRRNVRMLYHPFTSHGDGRRYAYLYPWRSFLDMRLGKIKSICPND